MNNLWRSGERGCHRPIRLRCCRPWRPSPTHRGFPRTRGLADRIGDRVLWGLTGLTAIATVLLLAAIIWKVLDGAWPAIDQFGLSFVWHSGWNATTNVFGARDFIIGTIVTSFVAVLIAGPIAIAIALFLTELAPRAIRGPIGSLVELLAAVPSVVIGLWGILVLGPVRAAARRAAPAGHARVPADLQRPDEPFGRAARDPRPDDHDHPDHVVDLPRAFHRRARTS